MLRPTKLLVVVAASGRSEIELKRAYSVVASPAISAPNLKTINEAIVQEGMFFVVAVNLGKLDLVTSKGSSPSIIIQKY